MDAQQRKQIEKLYFEMYDKMLTYGRSCLCSDALAEEAVQETFRIACQKPDELCSSPNPQGWLVLAMRNTVRNVRKRQKAAKRIIVGYVMSQSGEISVNENRIRLDVLYGDLAESEDFKILSEMALQGKSHKEMADARGISVAACKKRVQRAKAALQKKIKE